MIENNGPLDNWEGVDWTVCDTLIVRAGAGRSETESVFNALVGLDRRFSETNGQGTGEGYKFLLREIWADNLNGCDLAKRCTVRLTIGFRTYLQCPLTAILEQPRWFTRPRWAAHLMGLLRIWLFDKPPYGMRFQYPLAIAGREPFTVAVVPEADAEGIMYVRISLRISLRGALFRASR